MSELLGPYRGPLWGPYGPNNRPLEGALLRYPSGVLRTLQGLYITRRRGPIGGLGDPYGPIPRVKEGPLRGPEVSMPEGYEQKGPLRGLEKGPLWTPKGTPTGGPFLCYVAFKLSHIMKTSLTHTFYHPTVGCLEKVCVRERQPQVHLQLPCYDLPGIVADEPVAVCLHNMVLNKISRV